MLLYNYLLLVDLFFRLFHLFIIHFIFNRLMFYAILLLFLFLNVTLCLYTITFFLLSFFSGFWTSSSSISFSTGSASTPFCFFACFYRSHFAHVWIPSASLFSFEPLGLLRLQYLAQQAHSALLLIERFSLRVSISHISPISKYLLLDHLLILLKGE